MLYIIAHINYYLSDYWANSECIEVPAKLTLCLGQSRKAHVLYAVCCYCGVEKSVAEDMDQFAKASQTLYSTVTAAHIHLSGLGQLSGAHFIIG